MTESQAEKLATVLMGVTAAGAIWLVVRTPALRRLAWALLTTTAAAAGPGLITDIRSAWDASARSVSEPPSADPSPEGGLRSVV